MNCYNGITVPEPIEAPCGGEFTSTSCAQTPTAIAALDISAGATQTEINSAITNALTYKEEQIVTITEDIQPYLERKIYRGTFLGSVLETTVEDTINDIVINNSSTGIYEITSSSLTMSTNIFITPNSVAAGYGDITISYDYSNALTGVIIAIVKNLGVLVNLLESPIKIEI